MSLDVAVENFDIRRGASVFSDNAGYHWWTMGWFNGSDKGEKAVEISREMAVRWIQGLVSVDAWLSRYYPKQMGNVRQAIAMTRQHLGV